MKDILSTSLKPTKNNVFVSDLDKGAKKTFGGIILLDDDMKERGIRDRWALVHSIGPEVTDIAVGEWVLIKQGRWTNRIDFEDKPIWRIEYPDAVLLVADQDPRLPEV